MDIYVCSDDPAVKKTFAAAASAKAKANRFHFIGLKDALPAAAKADGPAVFYIDASCPKKQFQALRKAAAGNKGLRYALLDPAGGVEDVAAALKDGALDYLGPKLCRIGVTAARLAQALAPLAARAPRGKKGGGPEAAVQPARDWQSVRPGGEYLFRLLYIEIDGHRDAGLRSSEADLNRLIAYFQKSVERSLAPEGGRLWIWNDFSGIVLFPCVVPIDAVAAACLRFMLSRRILSVDQDIQKLLFSYRLVLMEGATVFRERGKTGTIISDAVNSLSHVGARFARPGNCYLARDLYDRLSPGLKKCFAPAGTFEGMALVKMKLPAKY